MTSIRRLLAPLGPTPALLVGLALSSSLAGCAEECDGAAIITGQLLGPDGEPASQELEFTPAGDTSVEQGVSEDGADQEVHATSFSVTADGGGRFSVAVEPGQWQIQGNWQGEPPEGDGCDVWGEVFAEYCGEHELTLAFECYDLT